MENVKISVGFFLIGLLLVIVGCEGVLTETQLSVRSVDDYYNTEEQANRALNGLYSSFWRKTYRDGTWLQENDLPTNILQSYPDPNAFDLFAWTVDNGVLQNLWEGVYRGSNRAGTLIDNIENADIDPEVKEHIVGQAKFIRALNYFNAVRIFGGVPVYTHGTEDLSEVNKSRSSVDEVYQQIITDLQEANEALSPHSASDHQAGRATAGAAKALLAKVYIQRREWQKAANKAKEVIDLEAFGLFQDYADIFDPEHSNGKEMIFSVQHGQSNPGSHIAQHLVWQFGPPSFSLPDGTDIEFAKLHVQTVQFQVEQEFFDRTPATYRKWMSMRQKMPFYWERGSSEVVRDTVALPAPFIVKFYHPEISTGFLRTGVNTPILRYSDVLLIYAEALNEVNASPPPEAYNAINKVRARARGVGTSNEQPQSVYPPLEGLNKQQFRDSVLVEMARELVGEGHRRFQLLRHDRFIQEAQAEGIDAVPTDILYPIPNDEINRNPNLTQNEGY